MSLLLVEPEIAHERVDESSEVSVFARYSDEDADFVWEKLLALYDDGNEFGTIDRLEVGYRVIRDIPYEIIRDGNEFLASFEDANISITGVDPQDAFQSLVAEILDTFDALTNSENNLSPAAASQLAVLRSYIVQA